MGAHKATLDLADLIDDLRSPNGFPTVRDLKFGDMAVGAYNTYGFIELADAQAWVEKHHHAAQAYLFNEKNYLIVEVTAHHFAHLKRNEPCEWADDKELSKCISGPGKTGIGWHFALDECLIWVWKVIGNLSSAEGKRKANFARMRLAAEKGLLNKETVKAILEESGVDARKIQRELKGIALEIDGSRPATPILP